MTILCERGDHMAKLIRNGARCRRCDTVIESKHRRDYVRCPCGSIAVDGGLEYAKRSVKSLDDIEELSEWEGEDDED